MPSLSCPECNHLVAANLATCDQCGYPMNENKNSNGINKDKRIGCGTLVLILGVLFYMQDQQRSQPEYRPIKNATKTTSSKTESDKKSKTVSKSSIKPSNKQ